MLGVFSVSVAQTVTIDPVGAVTVVEGSNLIITCTDGVTMGLGLILRENSQQLIGDDTPPNEVNDTVRIFRFPVDRTRDGNTYECLQLLTAVVSSQTTLTVICKWNGVGADSLGNSTCIVCFF